MYLRKQGTAPNQAHVGIPEGLYEDEHGRQGFSGPSSHLYHRRPPTEWSRIEGPLRPRACTCTELPTPDQRIPDGGPVMILQSPDARVCISRRHTTMTHFVRNADGDEMIFVHQGQGRLETDYGLLPYEPGDYLVIPKGTTYRVHVDPAQDDGLFLIVETQAPLTLPERGPLGRHALFDPGVIVAPELGPSPEDATLQREWEVRIRRAGEETRVYYPYYPMDVEGWKGDLWAAKLNVRDFRPVTSPRYHLPPSVHATFHAGGLLISTFAPRPLETDPQALRVPFYHRNIDYDEVLFYHRGEFFSRAGIRAGMLTVHPQGIHHGPHPQAVAASKSKDQTNEVAVMIESRHPFRVTAEFETAEFKDYAMSWSRP
ncbi:MAG: homogentisate 1,2-dioxygenase [Nitrospira sp.]|nr:homogentisate 1,2-dioxygenase [Nitrospira sp.]MBS0176469.1 homogentisate 1,2-dioxygenase [Nitrospira sp.]MCW5780917.1 homogentisate 1,2-dioxygenase [Nitrospira sp.]HNO32755.1 homogentisate 1,2-dioxygenase [Nitrospira sp.]